MLTTLKKHPLSTSIFAFAIIAQSARAQGADGVPPPPPSAMAAPTTEIPAPQAAPAVMISNGQPQMIQRLGITISPIAGWEVAEGAQGMSLVMQEPKAPVVIPKPGEAPAISYRRSISVTSFDESYALNASEANKWMQRLQEIIGKGPGINNLVINPEYKFFNYRQANDGLVIYAQYTANEIPMTQVNVIVPGANNAYLITYSDMQSRFDAQPQLFSEAWGSMVSLDVTGEPVWRYADDVTKASFAGGFLLVGIALILLRRRRAKKFLDGFEGDAHGEFSSGDNSSMSSLSSISALAPLSDAEPLAKAKSKKQKSQPKAAMMDSDKMRISKPRPESKKDDEERPISSVAASIHSGIWALNDKEDGEAMSSVSQF